MQIARVRDTGREVAVKLYASRRAFEADAARILDQGNALHGVMPRVRRLYPNTDVALRDVCGNPLPPFIVMDKAEPLDTFCSLHQPRRSEAFSVRIFPWQGRAILSTRGCEVAKWQRIMHHMADRQKLSSINGLGTT